MISLNLEIAERVEVKIKPSLKKQQEKDCSDWGYSKYRKERREVLFMTDKLIRITNMSSRKTRRHEHKLRKIICLKV